MLMAETSIGVAARKNRPSASTEATPSGPPMLTSTVALYEDSPLPCHPGLGRKEL